MPRVGPLWWPLSAALKTEDSPHAAYDGSAAKHSAKLCTFPRPPGVGNGNPPQFSCLENSHGQRSLVGYSPWCESQTRLCRHASHLLVKPDLCCGSGSQQVSRGQSVASTISFSELSSQKYPGIFLPRPRPGLDLPRNSWAHISALTQPPIVSLDLSPSGGVSSCPRIS